MKTSFFRTALKPKRPSDVSDLRKHLFPILFVILGIFIIYANSLKAGFYFDDAHIKMRPNLHLKDLSAESIKGTFYFTPNRQKIYRPLTGLSLGLNYYFGKDHPFGYHVVNITIHALCTLAVYLFLYTLLSIPGIKPAFASKYKYEISVISTFLFAFHPLQVNVATYIIQRMASMAALFYLLSVTGYILYRNETLRGGKTSGIRKYSGLFMAIISGVFSISSKENAAMLPVTIMVADYLFFYNISDDNQRYRLRRIYAVSIAMILILVAWLGIKPFAKYIYGYALRDFTLGERLLTQPRIVIFYLFLLLVPKVDLLNLNHDVTVSRGLMDPPQTLFSIIGIVIIIAFGLVALKKFNLLSFVIWWFLGNLVIESTIFPLELLFEHRTYLPGVVVFLGFSMVFVYFVFHVLKKKKWLILLSFILIFYGNGTYLRNVIFRSQISLWQDVVQKSPRFARAHSELGVSYMTHGYFKEAEEELNIALSLDPDMPETLVNLGKIYMNQYNRTREAIALFKKAQIADPQKTIGFMAMADAYTKLKQYAKAEHFYRVVLRNFNFYGPAINNFGRSMMLQGKMREAKAIFKKGIALDPFNQLYYLNLALIYYDEDAFDEAQNILKRYLALNSQGKEARALLHKMEKMISEKQCS